ncbi:MAG TPA: zinc metallopeptidase [bacterium]
MFFDSSFLLLLPAIALVLWAQFRVKSTFAKYSKVRAGSGLTGSQVAKKLLSDGGLSEVKVEEIPGSLSDHYDPRTKVLRLSEAIAQSDSVAALGVAAHEVGHALQHKQAFGAFRLRQSIVPVANFGSSLAIPFFFAGLIFSSLKLMDLGIVLFSAAVAFQLVTLPVEFNASSRALALLQSRGYLVEKEVGEAKRVLNAAALTYVAATAMALMQLLRLVVLRNSRD